MVHANSNWAEDRQYVSPALAMRVPGGGVIWLIGRVVLGGLFMMSGFGKLMAPDRFAASLTRNGIPESIAPIFAWLGAGVETIGGLFIVLGFATNWTSLALLAFTIVAALIAHRFWDVPREMRNMQTIQFQKNMMIAAAFCFLYVAGGGPYSIDRWRRFR